MEGKIQEAKTLNPNHSCLYEGDSANFLGAVAPWLFEFREGSEFAKWVAENAGRKSWGIFFRSDDEPIKLYKHLRKYLIVQNESGGELYFRFYDPKVLGAFLPTCDEQQLVEFFGPIKAFIAEDVNGLLIEYEFLNSSFEQKHLNKDVLDFFQFSSSPLVVAVEALTLNSSPLDSEEEIASEEEEKTSPSPESRETVDSASGEAPREKRNKEEKPSTPKKEDDQKSGGGIWDFGY